MEYETIIADIYQTDDDYGYEYVCPNCGRHFKLNDADLEYGGNVCPSCFEPTIVESDEDD